MASEHESSYICPACGEEIHVPVEVGVGRNQEYVEDCPVCCRPVVLTVEVFPDGEVRITSCLE